MEMKHSPTVSNDQVNVKTFVLRATRVDSSDLFNSVKEKEKPSWLWIILLMDLLLNNYAQIFLLTHLS